jgi:hypothetical protein
MRKFTNILVVALEVIPIAAACCSDDSSAGDPVAELKTSSNLSRLTVWRWTRTPTRRKNDL